MLKPLHNWLQSATFTDPIERRQAPLIQLMLLGLIAADILSLPLTLLLNDSAASSKTLSVAGIVLGLLLYPFCLWVIRRQRFALAVMLSILSTLISLLIILMPTGLNSSWLTMLVIMYPITFAGLLAGRRMLWLTIGLTVLMVSALGFLGNLAPSIVGFNAPGAKFSAEVVVEFVFIIGFLGLAFDRFGSALRDALTTALLREQELEQVRASQENTISTRTDDLRHALSEVEQRETRLVAALGELRASQAMVQELSAPVVPVLPGVLVAPLVGALSADRAEMLTGNVLHAVEQQRARYMIFDITGVPLVDSHVAKVLLDTAAAIKMLGAQVFIVGIRPEVAQTMVSLNIDIGTVVTYPDLQEAVEALLGHNGWVRQPEQAPASRSGAPLRSMPIGAVQPGYMW